MKDDWRRDVTLELGPKPLKRGGGILLVALHLDRIDVVCGRNFRLREHEIDLHLVQGILAIVIEVKIELLPDRTKHLRNGILDDHSLVHFELSEENRLHDVGERGLVLRKRIRSTANYTFAERYHILSIHIRQRKNLSAPSKQNKPSPRSITSLPADRHLAGAPFRALAKLLGL